VPAPPERDGDHGFREEHERRHDREEEWAASPAEEPEVAERGECVQGDSGDGERVQPFLGLVRCERALERPRATERRDAPRDHRRDEREPDEPGPSHEAGRCLGGELDRGRRREERGHKEPDGRRHDETRVRRVEEDTRRRERVQAEEPGRREERERDEEEPRVRPPARRLTRHGCERDVDRGGDEHEPEVGGVVLPDDVEARCRKNDDEPDERGGEGRRDRHAAHSRDSSARRCSSLAR
jgi:hypothetical protein